MPEVLLDGVLVDAELGGGGSDERLPLLAEYRSRRVLVEASGEPSRPTKRLTRMASKERFLARPRTRQQRSPRCSTTWCSLTSAGMSARGLGGIGEAGAGGTLAAGGGAGGSAASAAGRPRVARDAGSGAEDRGSGAAGLAGLRATWLLDGLDHVRDVDGVGLVDSLRGSS